MNNPEFFYIHWPFCKNKCHYCDFISFQNHENFEEKYHIALCKEILSFAKSCLEKKPVKTIYLGGGTPSLYPLPFLKELFNILNQNFDLKQIQEVTIEVNPQDITEEKLKFWSELGINRLSVGVQILDDKILENLNRMQKKQEVFNLMDIAPKYFDNISVDLILGLPGVTKKMWWDTLKKIVSFPIKHISVYLLTVYEKTPLFFKIKSKQVKILKDEDLVNLYDDTIKFLDNNGFEQYEISNFAKSGFESVHNQAYWNLQSYKGFGLNASSFDGDQIFVNQNNLISYLDNCEKNVCFKQEKLNRTQKILEKLMLNLRQKKGLDLHGMLYFLRSDEKEKFLNGLEILKSNFLVQEGGGIISLTTKGMMLENEVILKLL